MDGMTAIDALATDELQELAHRHLLMHFTRNGAFGPGGNRLLVLERGEGRVRLRHRRQALSGRAELAVLLPARLLVRRGDGGGRRASSCRRSPSTPTGRTAHPPAIRLAEALAERAPGDLNRVFFTCGGSESVEAAWKIVRQHYLAKGEPQRTKAIAREIAYHGVTLGALSFTGVRPMKEPFGASPIPVVRVSNTNALPSRAGERPRRPLRPAARGDGAGDRRGRPRDRGDDHRRAGAERRRLPGAARGLLGRPARDRRPLRHRAGGRRGHHRLRAHRRVVRLRALRAGARRDHARQGHHVGVRADGRRPRLRQDRRAAVRGGPDAAARHHVRRPPAGGGDRAAQHRDLRARGRARERPRARGLPARAARGAARPRADRRRRPRRGLLLGARARPRRRAAPASAPRSASGCCAASSPAGCSRKG